MRLSSLLNVAAVAAVFSASAAFAVTSFEVRYESAAPGMQNTSATFTHYGVENFDARPLGFQNFTTDFGSGGLFTGVYSNVQVNNVDQWGGAFGTGKYPVSFTTYALDLSSTVQGGVNFFGYWLSALDSGNDVTFSSHGQDLFTFKPTDVLAAVGGNSAYYGNPNSGANTGEPYIFLSFFANNLTFDRVVFNQATGGGYESDNHTVGHFTGYGTGTSIPLNFSVDNVPPGVPEPAVWLTMLSGFGLMGYSMRRRQVVGTVSA